LPAEPWDDSSSAEALGSLMAGTWRPGRTLRVAASMLAEATYAVVAPRRPRGNRGPKTERSPVGAAVVSLVGMSRCEATRAACRRSIRACRERWPERRRRRGARSIHDGGRWCRGDGCDGYRGWPGFPPRMKFVTVGGTHEVAVPCGLKVQAPRPDFESDWEGVRAANGIPLAAVLGANHHREGW
jgi:hypothetical protein